MNKVKKIKTVSYEVECWDCGTASHHHTSYEKAIKCKRRLERPYIHVGFTDIEKLEIYKLSLITTQKQTGEMYNISGSRVAQIKDQMNRKYIIRYFKNITDYDELTIDMIDMIVSDIIK